MMWAAANHPEAEEGDRIGHGFPAGIELAARAGFIETNDLGCSGKETWGCAHC